MKKIFLSIVLGAVLLFPAMSQAAEAGAASARNPVELLTGEVWLQTPPENKRAFLFGVDTALAIEKAVNDKLMQTGKQKTDNTTIFNKEWNNALRNVTRPEIIEQVDQWYKANPDKMNRPVMDVIWYEIIAPRMAK